MIKIQRKRTAVALMVQNGISRNTKCVIRDSFTETVTYHHYIKCVSNGHFVSNDFYILT